MPFYLPRYSIPKNERLCPFCNTGQIIGQKKLPNGVRKKWSCGHSRSEFSSVITESGIPVSDNLTARKIMKRTIVEDHIPVTDHLDAQVALSFNLTDKVYIGGTISSPSHIELRLDPQDSNYLVGFTIKAKDLSEESLDHVVQQANRLTNLLSHIVGIFVYHDRPEVTRIENGQRITMPLNQNQKKFDLDLTDPRITSVLSDGILNRKLAHAARGLKASDENDPDEMVKEFHKAMMDENVPHLEKYNHLRDGVSHSQLGGKTVRSLKSQFKMDTTTNQDSGKESLDRTDPKTRMKLLQDARKYKDESLKVLNKKLGF